MIQAKPEDVPEGVPCLICRSDTWLCALPLASVAEIMRPLALEALAAMPPFLLGLSVIRGRAVPVVDAAGLLGSMPSSAPARRIVLLKVGERRVALAVESVLGIRAIAPSLLDEVPPLLGQAAGAAVSAIAALDAQLLLLLQAARLVSEAAWAAIDSRISS